MEYLSEVSPPQPQLKVTGKVKTFVLDTNVLLHDPQSIFKFEDNNLAIPVEVLEELDTIKAEQSTERGRNARRVHRILQELLPNSRAMLEGVKLPNGGTLSVIINRYLVDDNRLTPAMQRLRAVLPDLSKKDNRIIACALFVQETFPPPTILVTKDVNVQLKARAVGLESEDYLNDKVPEPDEEASYREIPLSIYELQRFCSEGKFEIDSLVGTISKDGPHIHLSLSDSNGKMVGGHLMEGCLIYTTAEIAIGELEDVTFSRPVDPETTYDELVITPSGLS